MTLQTSDKDVNYCVHRRQDLDTGMYMRNTVMKSGCVLEHTNPHHIVLIHYGFTMVFICGSPFTGVSSIQELLLDCDRG